MNVSEYIFKVLSDLGNDTVFLVTGGQAMFLNDALYKNKKFTNIICTHHEQTAGMAAEAYGRITGKLGIALVTAGPGSINVMNGLLGGWTDSSPMLIISGQSNLNSVQYQQKTNIRQFGIQGINIKPFVEKATKYFVTVDDPCKIDCYIEQACYFALNERPGPVWLDVPLDIQKMEVPLTLLQKFKKPIDNINYKNIDNKIDDLIKKIKNSKRPLLIAGQGVRLSDSVEIFKNIITKLNIPLITSRLGIDIIESDNPLFIGRPGNYGDRAANFSVSNADLIISIGSRLSSATIGHNPSDFGRNAFKVMIDIDDEELNKPGAIIDLKIKCDIKSFCNKLKHKISNITFDNNESWIKKCNGWKEKYSTILPEYEHEEKINSYYFMDKLSQQSQNTDLILVDTGSCFHVACQSWKIKKGQRFLTTGGLSSMGYWVAGIGGCIANNRQNTIVITGDGSLQFNLQEFATIKHNNLKIKTFIINNNGYLLIRHTQKNFMDERYFGESPNTGVWCPDSLKIAEAYGIKSVRIDSIETMEEKIKEVLEYDGPVICDVMTSEWQLLIPRISSEKLPDGTLVSKPYEDMFPFISREEYIENMNNL